tara:strand:- start:2758 stop:3075 length:318 start_codon:yes stop_codon:yes gene_type:complete
MNLTIGCLVNMLVLVVIVLLAFLMQVMPFLLVLTLINISFGISSSLALIVIPAVLFAMLITACIYAGVRARNKLPMPLPVYRTDHEVDQWKGFETAMDLHSRRYR